MVNQIAKVDMSASLRHDPDFKSDFKTETQLSPRDHAVQLIEKVIESEYEDDFEKAPESDENNDLIPTADKLSLYQSSAEDHSTQSPDMLKMSHLKEIN